MTITRASNVLRTGAVSLALLLGGCATYHALPLAKKPDLSQAPMLGTRAAPAPASRMPALDLARVARIARRNDPDLAAARDRVAVARAKAYDAGLLPDPTLGYSLGHPFNGGAPSDHHNPWSINLTEDLVALITHGAKHSAATAHYAATLLSWRWQSAQVALKAQTTYLDIWAAKRAVAALQKEKQAATEVLSAARRANAAGALSPVMYQQVLQQYASVRERLQKAEDRKVQLENTLFTLLRMRNGQPLHLSAPPAMSAPAPGTVSQAISGLPRRRLDLLALQAGYRSADARLRADILAQFPLLSIGFNRSRDNTGVNSYGFDISLRLPIFNGNRGKIAIDRATRKALNAAYQAHLDSAANTARATYRRLRLARRALHGVASQLPALARAAKASTKALAQGNATRFEAYSANTAWLDARINADRLRAETDKLALLLRVLLAQPQQHHGKPT